MSLNSYLQRVGLVTGPSLSYTGHTKLGMIKSVLLGHEVKIWVTTTYQLTGTYVHEMLFLGDSKIKLVPEEQVKADGMLRSLKANKLVMMLIKDAECEKTHRIRLRGFNFQYTPDAVQAKKKGRDLKTTICSTEADFVQAAFEYGYFRQDVAYSEAHGLTEFVDIGIQKVPPHRIYIVVARLYKDLYDYAEKEFDFLTYFYKHYGNFKSLEH